MENTLLLHGFSSYLGAGCAGLIATTAMTLFALAFSGVGLLSANAIEALGSSVTGKLNGARPAGFALHAVAGVAFAFIYSYLIMSVHLTTGAWPLVGGAIIGAIHGYIVSFFVVISIGEYSHYAHVRENGIGLGLVYLASHVMYGITLGSFLCAFRVFS